MRRTLPPVYDEWERQDFVVSHNNPYHAGAARCDFSQIAGDLRGARAASTSGVAWAASASS